MTTLEVDELLQKWSLQSMHPYKTKEEKQFYQDKLDKVNKLVEELNNEQNIQNRTHRLGR